MSTDQAVNVRKNVIDQLKANQREQNAETQRLRQNVNLLNQVINAQKKEIVGLQDQKDILHDSHSNQIETHKLNIEGLEASLADNKAELDSLRAKLVFAQDELEEQKNDDELKTKELEKLEELVKQKDETLASQWNNQKDEIQKKQAEIVAHQKEIRKHKEEKSALAKEFKSLDEVHANLKADHSKKLEVLNNKHDTLANHVDKLNQIIALHEEANESHKKKHEENDSTIGKLSDLLGKKDSAHNEKDQQIDDLLKSQLSLNKKVNEVMNMLSDKETTLSDLHKDHFELQQAHQTKTASHEKLKQQNVELMEKLESVSHAYFDQNEEHEDLKDAHSKMKERHDDLDNINTLLRDEMKDKEKKLKDMEDLKNRHLEEKIAVEHFATEAKKEKELLQNTHDELMEKWGAASKEEFEAILNKDIKQFEDTIDAQTQDMETMKKNYDTLETNYKKLMQVNDGLETILEVRDTQIQHYEELAVNYEKLKTEHERITEEHISLDKLHKAEKLRASNLEELHSIAEKERNEMTTMKDEIHKKLTSGEPLNADSQHDLEVAINKHLKNFEDEIDQQEKIIHTLKDAITMEKAEVEILEDDLEKAHELSNLQQVKLRYYETELATHVDNKKDLMKNQETLQKKLIEHADEAHKAKESSKKHFERSMELEQTLNTVEDERKALHQMQTDLLKDFEVDSPEEFKKHLKEKIDGLENTVNKQEIELKQLKADQTTEYEKLNKDLQEILAKSGITEEVSTLHQLNEMIEHEVLGTL